MTPKVAIDAFFRGAFEAWLKDRRPGEEIHAVEEREAVYLRVSTTETADEMRVMVDDLASSRQPRQRGARVLGECLAVTRQDRQATKGAADA